MADTAEPTVMYDNLRLTKELQFLQKLVAFMLESNPGLGYQFLIENKLHSREDIIKLLK